MTWTKKTKVYDSGYGLLEPPGFLVSEFLVAISQWAKRTKVTGTWTKLTDATGSWTKRTKA
jgi:hypothetical protein